jgi:hypothetical protein
VRRRTFASDDRRSPARVGCGCSPRSPAAGRQPALGTYGERTRLYCNFTCNISLFPVARERTHVHGYTVRPRSSTLSERLSLLRKSEPDHRARPLGHKPACERSGSLAGADTRTVVRDKPGSARVHPAVGSGNQAGIGNGQLQPRRGSGPSRKRTVTQTRSCLVAGKCRPRRPTHLARAIQSIYVRA